MKAQTTERREALAWWRSLSDYQKLKLCKRHFCGYNPASIANSSARIEVIYRQEKEQGNDANVFNMPS